MIKLIAILIVALLFEAVGVVFLSKGLKEIGELERVSGAEIRRLIIQVATNCDIVLGVFFEAIFFAGLLVLLAKADVSLIWPLTSLVFVLTTAAARFIRNEDVTPLRWTGVVLIMIGAGLVGWSDKQKAPRPPVVAANL